MSLFLLKTSLFMLKTSLLALKTSLLLLKTALFMAADAQETAVLCAARVGCPPMLLCDVRY
eukprot:2677577-Rhodomonas_salina.1